MLSIKNLLLTNFITKDKSLYYLADKGFHYIESHYLDIDRDIKFRYLIEEWLKGYYPNLVKLKSKRGKNKS